MINDIETEMQNFAGEVLVQIRSGCAEDYIYKLLIPWNKEYFVKQLKIIYEQGIYKGDREIVKSLESAFFPD